ncbi:MAG: outer membrane protein assembly factor BamD [Dokdonella sp.]
MIADQPARMRASPTTRGLARFSFLLLIALLGGCGLFGKKKADPLETLSVEDLYQKGVTEIDDSSWSNASRTFERLIGRFPFGPYSEQSQLNLTYAQYKNNKPDDAYSTVNRFVRTYPTHKNIDYAYYLRGLINFNREGDLLARWVGLDMTKRDQAFVRQSFDDFADLLRRYPNSRYVPDARQRLVYLRNGIAQAELSIALFYLRRGAYVAAANRAKSVVETYPRTPQVGDALAIMSESYHELGQEALATDSERVLKLNYPNHPYFGGGWPKYRSNWWKLLPLTNRG